MPKLNAWMGHLVTANPMLAHEAAVDSFRDVSVRICRMVICSRVRAPDLHRAERHLSSGSMGCRSTRVTASPMREVKHLSPGEVDAVIGRTGPYSVTRAWENWCRRAGRPFIPQ